MPTPYGREAISAVTSSRGSTARAGFDAVVFQALNETEQAAYLSRRTGSPPGFVRLSGGHTTYSRWDALRQIGVTLSLRSRNARGGSRRPPRRIDARMQLAHGYGRRFLLTSIFFAVSVIPVYDVPVPTYGSGPGTSDVPFCFPVKVLPSSETVTT